MDWAWAEVDRTGVLLEPKMLLTEAILSDQLIKGQLKHTNGPSAPFAPCPIRTWQPRSQSKGVVRASRPIYFGISPNPYFSADQSAPPGFMATIKFCPLAISLPMPPEPARAIPPSGYRASG